MLDITEFTEQYDAQAEYQYKMLVWGNYTFRDNLEADSLVVVMKNVIPFLSARYKIHFTVVVPELIKSFGQFSNVEQVIFPFPTYCPQMRAHFDTVRFMDILDWKRKDFDIVYSHVPEHTAQIANCIYNNTHLQPKIIGYSHWFEVKENAPYEKTLFDQAILGTLECEELGVNSEWLKKLVIERAAEHFNQNVCKELDRIIQPHYLGVDTVRSRSTNIIPKSIIFNHRDSAYTGWSWFVPLMDKLWKKRQDFTVYTTLTQADRWWNKRIDTPTRSEYLDLLGRMQFGVGCFQSYSAWSISVTDGLSVNTPYVLPGDLCYPEMVGTNYPYFYYDDEEFLTLCNLLLDHPSPFDTSKIAQSMLWENRIATWFGGWDKIFDLPGVKNSEALPRIEALIKKHRSITKFELLKELGNWGVQVKWTPYRNALRRSPNIKLYKDRYEYV